MPNDLTPSGGAAERPAGLGTASRAALRVDAGSPSAEPAASGAPNTGFAPPFRALLGTPAHAAAVNPALPPGPGQQTRASSADLPTVPGYEIVAELGRGGMGV